MSGYTSLDTIGAAVTVDADITDRITSISALQVTGTVGGPGAIVPPEVTTAAGQITLTWVTPTGARVGDATGARINGWRVSHRESGTTSAFTDSSVLAAGTTTYTITGLDDDKSYEIRIRARNDGGPDHNDLWGFDYPLIASPG